MLPVIAITNQSTVLRDDQVKAALPALQQQVGMDFYGYWNAGATLIFFDKNSTLVEDWWQLVILDDADQADALGYHELSSVGTPLGKIFAKTDQETGSQWTVTLSHELLEMIADPDIDTSKQAADGKFYAFEVCDAVEADGLGYTIDGTWVSDFVTPKWFNDQVDCDRYSFQKRVSKPLQLAAGGYISVFDGGNWTQLTAEAAPGVYAAHAIAKGSRRSRRIDRMTNKPRRSER